ncbi:MAG TPA: cysteine peptidase [Firmicutes bacterium]|jgi:C1A family cysteine protease|nr:cysteine peptidase [Bacillota bacterium]
MKRKYLLKPDSPDLRDYFYRSHSYKTVGDLPQTVDLRDKMSPIVDQGQLGSCTANAIASGLREYLEVKVGQNLVRLSRLFLYYEERKLEDTINEDSGASIRDGMKVLSQIGVCPEKDYPYDITKYTQMPTAEATAHAGQYKISEYHRIGDLKNLKVALSEELPVVFGIQVYQSFESEQVAKTGKIPMPKKDEQLLGGHAVLAVGYMDKGKSGILIVRNSWGNEWGDQGYCYMSYTVFNKLVMDMWTGH